MVSPASMSDTSRKQFESALRMLRLDRRAGPAGVEEAYQAALAAHGPQMTAEKRARLEHAHRFLADPRNWPAAPTGARPVTAPRRPKAARFRQLQPVSRPITRPSTAPGTKGSSPSDAGQAPPVRRYAEPIPPKVRRPSSRPSQVTTRRRKSEPAPAPAELPARVLARLDALANTWPSAIDGTVLKETLTTGEAGEAARLVHELIDAAHLVPAMELQRTLLELMADDPDRKWLGPRTALRLTLQMMAITTGDDAGSVDARRVHGAAKNWISEREKRGKLPSDEVRRQLRWADQLVAIARLVPTPVQRALADAAAEGALGKARPGVQRWAIRCTDEASSVRLALHTHAPDMLAAVDEVLPMAPPTRVESGKKALAEIDPRVWIGAGAAALVLAVLFATFAGGDAATVEDAGADPIAVEARGVVCEVIGHHRPMCVHARELVETMAEGDCGEAASALTRLNGEADRSRELLSALSGVSSRQGDLRGNIETLRERYAARCGTP